MKYSILKAIRPLLRSLIVALALASSADSVAQDTSSAESVGISTVNTADSAAVTMPRLWESMPKEMFPYIPADELHAMPREYFDNLKAEVPNGLSPQPSLMETLTSNYVSMRPSSASRVQMRLLYVRGNRRLVCVVRTFAAPCEESTIEFFDPEWRTDTTTRIPFDLGDRRELLNRLTHRPDSMSQQRFEELRSMLDPLMVSMTLSQSSPSLEIRLAIPFGTKKEKEELENICLLMKLKWNGERFVES